MKYFHFFQFTSIGNTFHLVSICMDKFKENTSAWQAEQILDKVQEQNAQEQKVWEQKAGALRGSSGSQASSLSMIWVVLVVLWVTGCAPFLPLVQSNPPSAPPFLKSWEMDRENSVLLTFSVPVRPDSPPETDPPGFPAQARIHGITTDPAFPGLTEAADDQDYSVQWRFTFLEDGPAPGQEFIIQGTMTDETGSLLAFLAPLYGINPHLPRMVVNEIRGVNSSARPEAIEVLFLEGGHLGGACLVIGHPRDPLHVLSFPPIEVESSQYMVIHFRAQETALEGSTGNFLNPPPQSPYIDGVINLYLPGGLSATAELILIGADRRMMRFVDGVFYSNKLNNPTDRFRGFGTRAAWDKAQFLGDSGLWYEDTQAGMDVDPEDFPSSTGMTSTRTLNRWPPDPDNPFPGAQGWFVCATGQGTIGEPNSDMVHEP